MEVGRGGYGIKIIKFRLGKRSKAKIAFNLKPDTRRSELHVGGQSQYQNYWSSWAGAGRPKVAKTDNDKGYGLTTTIIREKEAHVA